MTTQMSSSNPDEPDFGDELFHTAEQTPAADAPRRRPWRRRVMVAALLIIVIGGGWFGVQRYEPDLIPSWAESLRAALRPAEAEAKTDGAACVTPESAKPSPELLAEWTRTLHDVQQQGRDALARQQAEFRVEAKRMQHDFNQAMQRTEQKLAAAEKQSAADRDAVQRLETQLGEIRTRASRAEKDAARFETELVAKQSALERIQKQLADAQAKLAETQELARKTQEELLQERSRTTQLRQQVDTMAQTAKSRVDDAPTQTPAPPLKSPDFLGVDPRIAEAAASAAVKRTPQRLNWQGRLSEFASRDRKNSGPSVVHTVTLRQGVRYVIDLRSSDFDPILRLEDAQGREIVEDDDGGDGLNARIYYTPTRTGVYRLVVTRYSGTGDYALSVREP